MRGEAGFDRAGVDLVHVGVGDDRVAMSGRVGGNELSDLADEAGLDVDLGLAGAAYDRGYQATSPEPAFLLARRASMKSRSESRLR